jgi:nitric oxide dioxygenase
MTPDQIALVQQSFQKVAPNALGAAALFYNRLFETAPQLKALFRGDMTEQHKKLMATLAIVVNGLDKLETVLPTASLLARRHVGYGVTPEHYTLVGSALLWTLEGGLGPDWNEGTPPCACSCQVSSAAFSSRMELWPNRSASAGRTSRAKVFNRAKVLRLVRPLLRPIPEAATTPTAAATAAPAVERAARIEAAHITLDTERLRTHMQVAGSVLEVSDACPCWKTGSHPRSSRGQAFSGTCAAKDERP